MNVEIQAPSKDNLEFVMSTEWIWADDDANDWAVLKFIGNLGYYLGRSDITLLKWIEKVGDLLRTVKRLKYEGTVVSWVTVELKLIGKLIVHFFFSNS